MLVTDPDGFVGAIRFVPILAKQIPYAVGELTLFGFCS